MGWGELLRQRDSLGPPEPAQPGCQAHVPASPWQFNVQHRVLALTQAARDGSDRERSAPTGVKAGKAQLRLMLCPAQSWRVRSWDKLCSRSTPAGSLAGAILWVQRLPSRRQSRAPAGCCRLRVGSGSALELAEHRELL